MSIKNKKQKIEERVFFLESQIKSILCTLTNVNGRIDDKNERLQALESKQDKNPVLKEVLKEDRNKLLERIKEIDRELDGFSKIKKEIEQKETKLDKELDAILRLTFPN